MHSALRLLPVRRELLVVSSSFRDVCRYERRERKREER
jgi:hypothetical protein